MSLLRELSALNTLLTYRERVKLALLFVLMILGAIFEGIGIGAVPIFISFLTQPSILNDQELLSNWLPQLPDEPTRSLILWASVTFFSFVLLKGAFLTLIAYLQSRIVSLQIARLSNRMFRAYQSAPYDWILQRSTSELMRNIQTDTAKVIGGVRLDGVRRRRKRGGEMACVAGGSSARLDTAIRLGLEDILCRLFNKTDGKRAAGLVIRRCLARKQAAST